LGKKKVRVLIIGGSGFIGRNLVEGLNGRYDLLFPSHLQLDLKDSISVKNFFFKNKVDVVINAAGSSVVGKTNDLMAKEGVLMFTNLVKHSQKVKRIIQIGSGAEYDKSRPLERVKEEEFGRFKPKDPYGLFKFKVSKIIEKMIEKGDQRFVCLRPFGIFGKYENVDQRFISRSICRVLKGSPIEVYQDVIFDYVFIDDFVRMVKHFVEGDLKYFFYNIGTGEDLSLLSIVEEIKRIKETKITILKKGRANEYTGDISRLKEELPDFQFVPLKESLKRLFDWYVKTNSSLQ